MGRVLFICTGNYYRSRLAELLFNHYAARAGIDWEADSRGLLSGSNLKGLSPSARRYLEAVNFPLPEEMLRDPRTFSVDDLPCFNLVILLNRSEHLPELEKRFQPLVRSLEQEGKLRTWNVYDVPIKANWILQLIGWHKERPSQPEQSATEHIDLAVRALVAELRGELKSP